MGTSTIRLRSIKSSLPFSLPLRHSRDKLFQALSRFSVLEATESWAGPGNEATRVVQLDSHQRVLKLHMQQTNGHNHAIDGVEAQVERVKHLQMSWLMETGTLTHTFQQLDTVLFPLILANMFHCCIPKIPNNKVYKYSYNVHCLIDTHLPSLAPH